MPTLWARVWSRALGDEIHMRYGCGFEIAYTTYIAHVSDRSAMG